MDQPKIERLLQIMQLLSADTPYTIEEFPVTAGEVFQVRRRWYWEGDVNRFEGIGRFVIGLHREVVVVEGRRLWRG